MHAAQFFLGWWVGMQDIHEGLNFTTDFRGDNVFGLWTVQFSNDGRELVAGSSDKRIYVYDLEANKPVLCILAHKVFIIDHILLTFKECTIFR
jgi:WD40 repeat protein